MKSRVVKLNEGEKKLYIWLYKELFNFIEDTVISSEEAHRRYRKLIKIIRYDKEW